MKKGTLKNSLILLLLFICHLTFSQNVKNIDVESLSNDQIKEAQQAFKNSGLTEEEAINLARLRGASESQIYELRQRLKENPVNYQLSDTTAGYYSLSQSHPQYSVRELPFQYSGKVFGYSLFNTKNLTFEPSYHVQIPHNYEIGIDDQIIIYVWGNSQNNYTLTVNNNGQIIIPDVGPVYVAGLTFDKAEQKIKQRLTAIYADMGGDAPKTFAQLNLGQLRSISISIAGNGNAPGTYTLPATATVFNALYLSGGPDTIGSFRNIKILRNNQIMKTVDIYKFLIDANIEDNIQLKNEDIIFIPTVEKRVEVSGEFRRNGWFEVKENETACDLIRFAGGFNDDSFIQNLQLVRKTQEGLKIIDFSIDESDKITLQNGDELRNSKISDLYKNRIFITGAVLRPGEYAWEQGLDLPTLIEKSGSLLKDAFMNRGIVFRENPDLTRTSIPFNIDEVLLGQSSLLLQPEDSVVIKSHFELQEERYITISGEVIKPGKIEWSDNLTLSDAVFLSGGFREAADSAYIEVARRLSYEEASKSSDKLVVIYTTHLTRDLKITKKNDEFILKPYDRIAVKRAPGFREQTSAMITGEVNYAGNFAINNKNQRISDLVKLAGGITPYAFPEGATFTRQAATNPLFARMQNITTPSEDVSVALPDLPFESVAVNLVEILKNPGSETDLLLRDGDSLHIPEFSQTIKIIGSVQNPFSITYEKGKSLKYYIDKCGGYRTDALQRKVYIQYANGATASTKSFLIKKYPEILPGSTIFVPSEPEKTRGDTSRWLAIASTFSSIAVAIAAILR